MATKNIVLQTTNICKTYTLGDTKLQVLKNINLKIYQGEFIAIIGKSGSGKSTLMHILGLLDTPTSGSLFLNNVEVSKMSERQLAKIRNSEIGFVFQSFNLLNRTSTLDNVLLPLQYSSTPKDTWNKKALNMLEIVEMTHRLKNKPSELSGGQKQRVAIARALVNDPAIILADEPTGNLDSKTGSEIVSLFKKLNAQGKTIIIVTHDDEIAEIAQRKIVIKDGEIIN